MQKSGDQYRFLLFLTHPFSSEAGIHLACIVPRVHYRVLSVPKPRLGKEGQKIQKYFLEKDKK